MMSVPITLDLTPHEVRTIRVALAYWRERWKAAPASDHEVQAELSRIASVLARTDGVVLVDETA